MSQPDPPHSDRTAPVDPPADAPGAGDVAAPEGPRLSYKFQRLRERLRAAIDSGELSGKLPGERQLARHLRVNAKTLSKALTDLAAEGLLDRSIGRGTYVRPRPSGRPAPSAAAAAAPSPHGAPAPTTGGTPSGAPAAVADERWLIVCDSPAWSAVVSCLSSAASGGAEVQPRLAEPRPSFLKQFTGVVDFTDSMSDEHTRDLIVRGLPLVRVNHAPRTFSTHAVMFDPAPGAAALAREMLFRGHRRLFVVAAAGDVEAGQAVQRIAERYEGATVDVGRASDVLAAWRQGVTAFVAGSPELAGEVRQALAAAGVAVPGGASLGAVGVAEPAGAPCSGYFVGPATVAEVVTGLLRPSSQQPRRPAHLWLHGTFHDGQTLDAPAGRATGHVHPAVASAPPAATSGLAAR